MADDSNQKPVPPPYIFISHSRHDADVADSLARLCSRIGAKTWVDRSEPWPSNNWREKLDEAIGRSNVFLVLVSSAKQSESPWQSIEWSAICERKWTRPDIRIIPIRLDESEIPAFLQGSKALDGSNKAKLARCVEHISDYPTVRADPELGALSDEQRAEVTKRFLELLDALAKPSSEPSDVPPTGTQS